MASQNSTAADANTGRGGGGFAAAMASVTLSRYLLVVGGGICFAFILWRMGRYTQRQIRTIACLNNEKQRYFATASPKLAFFKRHILYAPIFRKRHNREFQLGSAVNVGTLPTRLELFLLLGYLATNVTFATIDIPFSDNFAAAVSGFRDRTGNLAVVNMVLLFLFAGRNNPLIALMAISFDVFNLAHRFIGRIVILEAVAHAVSQLMLLAQGEEGWDGAFQTVLNVPFMTFGFIATCALVAISVQASSPIRHAFYEIFKLLHAGLAILVLVGVFYHLQIPGLPQAVYVLCIIIPIWAVERTFRLARLIFSNFGKGGTRTVVEALPGSACRVTVTLARPWSFHPGQHAYLCIPSVGFWQSHPFSVAWTGAATDTSTAELPKSQDDVLSTKKPTLSFIVRGRTGFTNSLYKKASNSPDGKLTTKCFVEGPYGGHKSFSSYGTVVLFAGGVGITHHVPYVRELVAGYANGTVATRKLLLVWSIQSPEHLEWIRPWITEVLGLERRRDILRIMLFISRPRSTKEIHSPSATVQMFPGRPNVEALLQAEVENQVGAMIVSSCGPGCLEDVVRKAARRHGSNVDYVEEAFSW